MKMHLSFLIFFTAAQITWSLSFDPVRVFAQMPGTDMPSEISVTAEERFFQSPASVRVVAMVESSGASAAQCTEALEAAAKKVKDGLMQHHPEAQISVRQQSITSASQSAAITPQTAVKAQRQLGIEIRDIEKTGPLIDQVLRSGAAAVSNVTFLAPDNESAQLEAVRRAGEKARKKAEMTAASLGVKLGKILSANVTEEPEGIAFREGLERGLDALRAKDHDSLIVVTVRYAISQ